MNISVSSSASLSWLLPLSLSEWEKALELMLDFLPARENPAGGREAATLELALLDDADMAELNLRHLGCPGPTNVLSFQASPPALGWLAISVESIRREAGIYGEDPAFYALRMLAHGLAHLRGHSHGPEMERLSGAAALSVLESFTIQGRLPCLS
ncbi:MAG: rRNA maturation RNase YbeY [Desulfovibrionaceae bacterium]|nr:rRNA maturation RNase YbeY [Desulfovibrionaceae bacterium]